MFLVVQRVVIGEAEGLNAYLHEHGERTDWVWELPAGIPVEDPGRLVREAVAMQGRGRVAAFLDIAAPDGAAPADLRWGIDAIARLLEMDASLPLVVSAGPLFVRFELERGRRARWSHELTSLFEAGVALLA
jgi:hypothetical protein